MKRVLINLIKTVMNHRSDEVQKEINKTKVINKPEM